MASPLYRRSLTVLAGALLAARPALASGGEEGHELVLFPEWNELIPLIVLFLILIPLTNAILFKPVFRILDARNERIEGARKRAAKLDQDAAGVVERYRTAVRAVRAEADAERKATVEQARRAQAEQIGAERGEAERRMEAARRDIESSLARAREGLRSEIESLARDAAARILGRTVS